MPAGACTRRGVRWPGGWAVALGTVVLVCVSCASPSPPRHQLVSASGSCAAASAPRGPVSIGLQSDVANDLIVPVCIDGHGPYRFLVDTGASASALTSKLASRLGLAADGPVRSFFGVGRTFRGTPYRIRSWSVGAIPLDSQSLYSMPISLPAQVDGLLGSDVLSRFGTIRVDYSSARLVVDSPEGPTAVAFSTTGGVSGHLPKFFAGFHPQVQVPMSVVEVAGQAVATVVVTIGGHHLEMVIDTGAEISAVASTMTPVLGLVPQTTPVTVTGIGGQAKATVQRVGSWSMGSVRLVPEDLVSVQFPAAAPAQLGGLIGADVLAQFSAVTIDYASGVLALDQVPVL